MGGKQPANPSSLSPRIRAASCLARLVLFVARSEVSMHDVDKLRVLAHPATERMLRRIPVESRIVAFWRTMIGKKVAMAVTGAVMALFVLAHILGNLKFFAGPDGINAYARFLREVGQPALGYGQVLWVVRIVLLACVVTHVTAAVQLTRMKRAARPIGYAVKRHVAMSWVARIGPPLLLIFVVFHLLHLTGGVVGFRDGEFRDLMVHQNVVAAFSVWPVTVFYIVAMVALYFHLDHGIWSLLQTLGFSTVRNAAALKRLSKVVAILVFLGFISVPVAVMTGWVS